MAIYYLVRFLLLEAFKRLADTPLLAILINTSHEIGDLFALTTDSDRLLVDLSYLRIHLNVQVLLVDDTHVSGIALLLHPIIEFTLKDGCTDVSKPLLGYFWQLSTRLRQVLVNVAGFIVQELPDLFNS